MQFFIIYIVEGAYIFTKQRDGLSDGHMEELFAILNDLGIDTTYLNQINQSEDTCDEQDKRR